MSGRTILVWFRNDLRTHDNEVLVRALENGNRIVPVYCFDPRHFVQTGYGSRKTGVMRAAFILRNVEALREQFRAAGGDLFIGCGEPQEILPQLCERLEVDEVYHHREVAFEETQVSSNVEAALWKLKINLRHFIGHTLYHKEDLPFPVRDIPDNFAQFRKKTERESQVRPQFPKPEKLNFLADIPDSPLPTLEELGFDPEEIKLSARLQLQGGEAAAFANLDELLQKPDQAGLETTISPYVSIGALSPNTLYHALIDAAQNDPGARKQWEFQITKLMWRDYYRFMFKKHGNQFFKPEGLTGELPEISEHAQLAYEKWKYGQTGEPLVDEAMNQLNHSGIISDQQRQLTAGYLVQTLQGDWLAGAAWFEEKLLDYNPCSNYGNWAHIAGVGSSVRENKPLDLQKILAMH